MFAKKIVAGAALLAVAAVAQADVKLYGTLDYSVGSFKSIGGGKSTTKVESGNMMTSYIGFAGSEDLGGGLKAEFALETFIGGDTGANIKNQAGQFWSRGSSIALSGAFGKVALGQYDNALFTAGYTYNPFGSSMTFSPTMRQLYDLGSTTVAAPGALALVGFDTGWVNSITYETPTYAGFSGSVQFAPKETSATGSKNSFTVGGNYNAGPLSLAVVYVDAGVSGVAYLAEQTVVNLNGSYDFGVAKAFLQYTDISYESNSLYAGVADSAKLVQIGASVPVTAAGTVMVSYGQAKLSAPGQGSAKDTIFSLGYDHQLSKRTDAYVALTNEKFTDIKGATSFAVGVKHNF
jgi:predicted porin